MKIRSAVPENGCLVFFWRTEKNKTKNKKTENRKICKTYTHPPHRRVRKKRKKSRFLIFKKKRKERRKRNSANMYCKPKVLGLNTTYRYKSFRTKVVLYASTKAVYIINRHCFWAVVEITCSEKSAKSETSNFGLRFLHFFEMPIQSIQSNLYCENLSWQNATENSVVKNWKREKVKLWESQNWSQ